MIVQIEVTTRCNYDCFYCAGRDMEQRDMPLVTYLDVMNRHVAQYGVPQQVSLQGEGEPTLNKDLFDMAAHVRSLGAEPYTITNGTYRHPAHFAKSFRALGVSIDTLNSDEASSIGRYNLERVLAFVAEARTIVELTIHTVALSPSSVQVGEWCRAQGLRHVVQALQAKDDYSARYPGRVVFMQKPSRMHCEYLQHDLMRYYDVAGREYPCCFIKDTRHYDSIEGLRQELSKRIVPRSCSGCYHLQ